MLTSRSRRYIARWKRFKNQGARLFIENIPELEEFRDEDLEESPIAFECLGCGHHNDHAGECEVCAGTALNPLYF